MKRLFGPASLARWVSSSSVGQPWPLPRHRSRRHRWCPRRAHGGPAAYHPNRIAHANGPGHARDAGNLARAETPAPVAPMAPAPLTVPVTPAEAAPVQPIPRSSRVSRPVRAA